jgi:hypothetical protein
LCFSAPLVCLWNRVCFSWCRYLFYGSLAASCYAFFIVKPLAAYLLLPTVAWVFVATALNFAIWLLSDDGSGGGCEPLLPYTEVLQPALS